MNYYSPQAVDNILNILKYMSIDITSFPYQPEKVFTDDSPGHLLWFPLLSPVDHSFLFLTNSEKYRH